MTGNNLAQISEERRGEDEEEEEKPLQNKLIKPESKSSSVFSKLLQILIKLVTQIGKLLINSDILHIIRPAIYMFLVATKGKNSWTPFKVSLAIDLLIVFLVCLRLISAEKLRTIERNELTNRNYNVSSNQINLLFLGYV